MAKFDDKRIVSVGEDGIVKFWDAGSDDSIVCTMAIATRQNCLWTVCSLGNDQVVCGGDGGIFEKYNLAELPEATKERNICGLQIQFLYPETLPALPPISLAGCTALKSLEDKSFSIHLVSV